MHHRADATTTAVRAAAIEPAYTPGNLGALVPGYVIPITLEQLAVEMVVLSEMEVVAEQYSGATARKPITKARTADIGGQ